MWRWPRVSAALAGLGALAVLGVVGANVYVLVSSHGRATGELSEVPAAEVAIVPGALVEADGEMSAMLADRVERAERLYKAGKVEKVLVSGDHGGWDYDEPGTMRKALVAAGVAPEDVFEDHAGFNTRATMLRARSIFGVDDAVVVTQGFHMARALFLADVAGIDATGFTADSREWGAQGVKASARELFSRFKAVADVTLDTAAMAGPRIPISSADGRESWGPPPPPGTPPAGSPGR